jgi:uncharacterized protein
VSKYILLLVLGIIAYAIFKNYGRRGLRNEQRDKNEVKSNEDMVKCAYCGVHMPVSESTLSKGNYFCSNEHRLMHNK